MQKAEIEALVQSLKDRIDLLERKVVKLEKQERERDEWDDDDTDEETEDKKARS